MATAGEEGISEWVAANSTTKTIGKRFYEVKVLDWRRPLANTTIWVLKSKFAS